MSTACAMSTKDCHMLQVQSALIKINWSCQRHTFPLNWSFGFLILHHTQFSIPTPNEDIRFFFSSCLMLASTDGPCRYSSESQHDKLCKYLMLVAVLTLNFYGLQNPECIFPCSIAPHNIHWFHRFLQVCCSRYFRSPKFQQDCFISWTECARRQQLTGMLGWKMVECQRENWSSSAPTDVTLRWLNSGDWGEHISLTCHVEPDSLWEQNFIHHQIMHDTNHAQLPHGRSA